jgi:hypothetical protein
VVLELIYNTVSTSKTPFENLKNSKRNNTVSSQEEINPCLKTSLRGNIPDDPRPETEEEKQSFSSSEILEMYASGSSAASSKLIL